MKKIAIIPARGGSKRILRKNIKFFLGEPIISYENTECVGCSKIGIYNIINDSSFISSDGNISLSEAIPSL